MHTSPLIARVPGSALSQAKAAFRGPTQDLFLVERRHYQPNAAFSFAAKLLRAFLIL